MPRLVPVNDQQRQAENGCELDNTQKNSRQKSSLEMISSDNRTIINFCVPTTQDGVTRHTLLSALELNNNRLLDKNNSLNLTGENTPTSGSRFDEHTVTRRSTEAGEEDLSQGLPATESSVQAWPLRYIQQQAERTYQSIRQRVVRLYLHLAGPVPTRQRWNGTANNIMGLVAVVVGLGNMWRFPYYCYKHQGEYFLIAYGIVLLFIGFPLYVVDLSIGQYLSLGPTNAYASMAPLFSGLGWAMVISSALANIYYAVVLGWTITYIQRLYPFAPNSTATGRNYAYQRTTDFFRNEVVHLNDKDFVIQHQSVLSLGLVWLLVMIFLVRSIRSSSKVAYFTNKFLYGVMILRLVYSYWEYTKLGQESINLHFSTPQRNATELLTREIWADAVSQVLFSLGHFFGGAITLASYNDLRQNTLWTALSIVLWDTATSFLCGCLVFVSLSKLKPGPVLDVDIEAAFNANHTVDRMDMEVVFKAYHAFLANLNSTCWDVLFFLMILTLGFDCLMGFTKTVTTALFDNFTCLQSRYFPSVCTVVLVMFLLGLPMCTGNGFDIVECMHYYTCHLSLPLLGITHIALFCYVFGFDNLMTILRQELKVTVPKLIEWYLKLSLKYICPVAFLCLIISTTINTEFQGLGDSRLTPIKWILSIFPFLLVPAFAIYKFIRFRDRDWRLLLRPTEDFLPAYLREHSNRPDMFILADY